MIQAKTYTIRFLNKEQLTKDTYTFSFERPRNFKFYSGQYNRWTLPFRATDSRGSSRFFTISQSPLIPDKITFTTKIIQSDFKKALMELKENDEIKIFGPMGNFVLTESETRPKVFIAGGISITPYYAMLHFSASKKLNTSLILITSFSTPEEMIFYEDLKKLEEKNTNIKIIYTITNPEKSLIPWTGEYGRISQKLIKKYVPDITNTFFYVAGSPQMEEATKTLLNHMQIADENILTEAFTGY
jgi:ferredoxin-NADP reductase